MYAGISGLKNFQTKLDVIGNNIANVNTHGFKKSRVIFKDLYSQTVSGASGATASRGGVNPQQVGLGAQISTIDTLHGGGSTQFTGNTLDLAIEGDGFFIVADGTGPANAPAGFTNEAYTRAGNFYMDANGYLVNGDGKYVFGFAGVPVNGVFPSGDPTPTLTTDSNGALPVGGANQTNGPIRIPTNAQSMAIGNDGTVTFVDADGDLRYAGQLVMAQFPNPGGLQKEGGNYYQSTTNSGGAFYSVATEQGMGTIQSGSLEMSNVDLSEEFTEMIVAQRGLQANTRIITTSDEILQELVNLKR